ncbi:MAG: heme-copper oxidase subunit III [Chloroflexi bacterium]|jgi:cytochrome c oxidase subunit 3|nr:heme-copper oxidase subunit III [Chloroflexota bacterium]
MSVTVAERERAHVQTHSPHGAAEPSYAQRLRNNRLGLWLFVFSELFLFGGLLMSRFYLWRDPATDDIIRPELDQLLGLFSTTILLLSSVSMALAEAAASRGDRKILNAGLLITAILGIVFLGIVVGLEWQGEVSPGDGAFGAVFFGMTGLHAIHVLSGVILLLIILYNSLRGKFTTERHWGVEATAIYWHFVDVAWVFFYPALYLIGRAVHLG